jgi:crotonobetainyl-CoA:carnitine CoA-transferase CaiB-like acyl-CoA transferase
MARELGGLLVVTLEQAVAAPYCSCRLADLGARVIKIERAEGDFARRYDRYVEGQSAYFVWLNRGKESLVLDIKQPDDAALLRRLVAKADVFIQNLAPGAAQRAGFGSEALRALHPRLVTCDISGYGDSGPYSEMKAYDLLVQAETALAYVTGSPESPARVGVSVCDIAAGMYAHAAILAALLHRAATGEGRSIKVSLFDGMADWMTVPYLQYRYGRSMPQRPGLAHPTIAPYGLFECRDGGVLLSIQNEREWERLCRDVLGDAAIATDPRFADNPRRVENRAALEAIISGVFAALPREEVCARLLAAEIAFGRLNDVAGLAAHPQLRTQPVATPAGTVELVSPPAVGDDGTVGFRPVPAVGEHSERIRREFAA